MPNQTRPVMSDRGTCGRRPKYRFGRKVPHRNESVTFSPCAKTFGISGSSTQRRFIVRDGVDTQSTVVVVADSVGRGTRNASSRRPGNVWPRGTLMGCRQSPARGLSLS